MTLEELIGLVARGESEAVEFKETTGTRKAVHVTYVTPYGVKDNAYAKNVQSTVILDDLFRF